MMSYGYYGGMIDGFGWMWMALVLAVAIILAVWGTRGAVWPRGVAAEPTPLEVLRGRYAAGEITATEFELANRRDAR